LSTTPPRARTDELVVEELGDEVLVYDLRTDAAHCLDAQAAAVWRACDGETTAAEIAAATGTPSEGVDHALLDLDARDLIDSPPEHSRREAMKIALTAGAIGAAVPVIRSIVVPTPAQAQASVPCLPDGSACAIDAQCCSQNCNAGTCGPPL
jgi:hypothetical protein